MVFIQYQSRFFRNSDGKKEIKTIAVIIFESKEHEFLNVSNIISVDYLTYAIKKKKIDSDIYNYQDKIVFNKNFTISWISNENIKNFVEENKTLLEKLKDLNADALIMTSNFFIVAFMNEFEKVNLKIDGNKLNDVLQELKNINV
ncbi:MAG: hypothetical protein N3E37_03835 [Candidatus Micrarchaeota archaeon]|nr:hypothetical protein [Candidatus Micrarchaeota archaeon]